VRPADLTIARIRTDLQQVCGRLRWIEDSSECGELASTLAEAESALRKGKHDSTVQNLQAFLDVLDTGYGRRKAVTDNPYWLLKVNVQYLLAHIRKGIPIPHRE
jgi:hypothetical protein